MRFTLLPTAAGEDTGVPGWKVEAAAERGGDSKIGGAHSSGLSSNFMVTLGAAPGGAIVSNTKYKVLKHGFIFLFLIELGVLIGISIDAPVQSHGYKMCAPFRSRTSGLLEECFIRLKQLYFSERSYAVKI